MPNVEESKQILQSNSADLNVFNAREPRADLSIANLITGVGNIAQTEIAAAATRKEIESTSAQIEEFAKGKAAQDDLDELVTDAEQFFDGLNRNPVPSDVIAFQEQAKTLQDASRAGEISSTELKLRIQKNTRQAIDDNPFHAREIQTAANTALGRYSELLDFYETQEAQSVSNQNWLLQQTIKQIGATGLPISMATSQDQATREFFFTEGLQRISHGAAAVDAKNEQSVRDNLNARTVDADLRNAPHIVQQDIIDYQAVLVSDFGIPITPAEFIPWFETHDADQRNAIAFELQNQKAAYQASFAARFPLLSTEQQSQMMAPMMQTIDHTIDMVEGTTRAKSWELQNKMVSSKAMAKVLGTTEGKTLSVIGNMFETVPPSVALEMTDHATVVFNTLSEVDSYSPNNAEAKSSIRMFHREYMGVALGELNAPTNEKRTGAANEVMQSFTATTNTLLNQGRLSSEELRHFYTVIASPQMAEWMNKGEGMELQKATMRKNFAASTLPYATEVTAAYKKIMETAPNLIIDAAGANGLVSFEYKDNVRTDPQTDHTRAILNDNHAVHFNTIIRGNAHLDGGSTAKDYIAARSGVLKLMMDASERAGRINVTRNPETGEFDFGVGGS